MTRGVPPFHTLALAALARRLTPEDLARPEATALARALDVLSDLSVSTWSDALAAALAEPAVADLGLAALARTLPLTPLEVLAVALCAAVEEEPLVARAVAFMQAPAGGPRPTLGLCAVAFAEGPAPLHALVTGAALRCGVLLRGDLGAPLAEQGLTLPYSLYLALRDRDPEVPGLTLDRDDPLALPSSLVAEAERHARALAASRDALAIRSASPREARALAARIAEALARRPAFLAEEPPPGVGPLLLLRGLLPVFSCDLGPGERRQLPRLPGYEGPALVVCGPEGSVERAEGRMLSWTLPVPPVDERRALWQAAIGPGALADELGAAHRHRPGRIADLARLARHRARMDRRDQVDAADLRAAAWASEGSDLGALAQPLPDAIGDDVLVTGDPLRDELALLELRCRGRDGLTAGLGPAAAARYRPGVKALFVGPSGTGKTLAAGWLATRLGVPLYRVDLAGVTSKYIGETEKNLAQLLSRAEHADVALLFDEADAMFGKRTDIKEANDRFANAQTNYLLQRIESFEGLAILTSNSKVRFDAAFLRRLDAIIEFAPPGPEERRRLWQLHLGEGHALAPRELNRLAVAADLAGGHVRNVVLLAAALARREHRAIAWPDLVRGLVLEYKKLGRTVPSELRGCV